uniref:NACHT domain-containing protein n=1 Tax=Ciona savignyi TaxID=51511 RepID=H2ZDJ8_CIOSA
MSETSLYDSGFISDDVFRPTQPAGLAAVPRPSSERVQFDEILSRFRDQRFIGLVGAPGSGKTTCSKRLAKTVGKKCFFLKFMDMNYDSEISLKELIVDKPFRSLSVSLRQHAFEWILNNQAECVFILDGYDQARWRLPTRPINATPYDQIDIAHLIANICLGQLLQDSCIIFTSRQYSMISIPYDLRPKVIILLQDFNMEDTKTLFCALSSRMDKKLTTSPET